MKQNLAFKVVAGALLFALLVYIGKSFEHTDEIIDFHGPDIHPGYPDAFHTDYILPNDTVSPDGKYGLIFPGRRLGEDGGYNFLVAVNEPLILAVLETDSPEFEGKSNGGYEVKWSRDSSVALVTLESKWGPGDLFIVEFHNGKVSRVTNVGDKIRLVLEPEYKKSKAEPFNDSNHFIFDSEQGSSPFCQLENSDVVRIDAFVTTDPKGDDPHRWQARFRGVWDIPGARFTKQQFTRQTNRGGE